MFERQCISLQTIATPERALGEFVAPLNYEDLPEGSVETITRTFVDTIGVTLAGIPESAGHTASSRRSPASGRFTCDTARCERR